MSQSEIWIVMAERGEYSDRDVWPQAAFSTEGAAQAYCDAIGAAASEYRNQVQAWTRSGMYGPRPLFTFGGASSNPATYSVEKIPLLAPHHTADGALRHFCTVNACPDFTPVTPQ